MLKYLKNNLRYLFKNKIIYIILFTYFLALIIIFWQLGISSKNQYWNNYSLIRDDYGNIKNGLSDLENLIFYNMNSVYLTITNILVIVYLGFLIFILFLSTANGLDLIILTKRFNRHKIFLIKSLTIFILYLPILFISLIPSIVVTKIDPSTNDSFFWKIWINDLIQKIFIFLFCPIFIFLALVFKSKIGYMIIVCLLWPILLIIGLGLQSDKMGDLSKRSEYLFVTKQGEISKYYSYNVQNEPGINFLDYQNFDKYQNDSYRFTWTFDLYGQINYFNTLFNPKIKIMPNDSTYRLPNQYYDVALLDKSNVLSNTNDKFVGIKTQPQKLITISKIDSEFANFVLQNIENAYQEQLNIDLKNPNQEEKFLALIDNFNNNQEPKPLDIIDCFPSEMFQEDAYGQKYLIFNHQKKYLDEVTLAINYLAGKEFLPNYFVTLTDLILNEGDYYFGSINYQNYIEWYIMIIYPILSLGFFGLAFIIFQKKDYL